MKVRTPTVDPDQENGRFLNRAISKSRTALSTLNNNLTSKFLKPTLQGSLKKIIHRPGRSEIPNFKQTCHSGATLKSKTKQAHVSPTKSENYDFDVQQDTSGESARESESEEMQDSDSQFKSAKSKNCDLNEQDTSGESAPESEPEEMQSDNDSDSHYKSAKSKSKNCDFDALDTSGESAPESEPEEIQSDSDSYSQYKFEKSLSESEMQFENDTDEDSTRSLEEKLLDLDSDSDEDVLSFLQGRNSKFEIEGSVVFDPARLVTPRAVFEPEVCLHEEEDGRQVNRRRQLTRQRFASNFNERDTRTKSLNELLEEQRQRYPCTFDPYDSDYGKRNYTCHICGRSCSHQSKLVMHMRGHAMPDVQCPYCSKVFSLKATLQIHLGKCHILFPPNTPGKYNCNQCDKSFDRKIKIRNHMTNVHCGVKQVCPKCNNTFVQVSSLRRHLERFHSNQSKYVCQICNGNFGTSYDLNRHMSVHSEAINLCEHCGTKFKSKYSLEQHLILKHTQQLMGNQCKTCGAQFITLEDFKKHELHVCE